MLLSSPVYKLIEKMWTLESFRFNLGHPIVVKKSHYKLKEKMWTLEGFR